MSCARHILAAAVLCVVSQEGHDMDYQLPAIPQGYGLVAYDDCGFVDRQPHIVCEGLHTYAPTHVPGDVRVRSVAWGGKAVRARYPGLSAETPYVLAVTYASEPFNARVQSLHAGDVVLHGARPLPRGDSERLIFRVPRQAVKDGTLELEFRLEGPVNVVVSAVELWAPGPAPGALRITEVSALWKDLEGTVLDMAWMPVAGASVRLCLGNSQLATCATNAEGAFRFDRALFDGLSRDTVLTVSAASGALHVSREVAPSDLWFDPIRYFPMPRSVAGICSCVRLLDGVWRMRTGAPEEARQSGLDDGCWVPFRVPGQWLQQGLDVPPTEPVSVATEFDVPSQWRGRRVILRFDAVHAGARYWVNGRPVGESEHIFTPVEWDVTDSVVIGGRNRLDMEMVVQTGSERLAHASGYAFHNLGGIPRSVRLFALPSTHLRNLRIRAVLDPSYSAGILDIAADVEGPEAERAVVRARLDGADESRATQVRRSTDPATSLSMTIPGIRPWTHESPNLYALDIELVVGSRVVERITRKIGFRTIEIKGSQLYLNGKPIKLAGACRHETDPLTGRADTAGHARQDVELMKQANLNYLRTAHYPPTQELLDEADRQGMLVEVEAPFCWVSDACHGSMRRILTPTSAMVDYHHWHPSVIVWSLANESTFNPCFEASNRLVKDLDPTRPTTFNNPDPKRICDIANAHYPRMPFDDYEKDDPRPLLLGEYFFPVCHEQTDVRRNPGLRELWGAGHSVPDSDYGKDCTAEFNQPFTQPGEPPGAWTHMVRSTRVVGGAIWALLDEQFYLPGGKRAGYAWVHGFWGLVDGWRRPKPEHWLARQIFSPVWFPLRRLPFSPGARHIEIPVENRYSFTDLAALHFAVRYRGEDRIVRTTASPGTTGTLRVSLPADAALGDEVVIQPKDASGRVIVTATMWLGGPAFPALPHVAAEQTQFVRRPPRAESDFESLLGALGLITTLRLPAPTPGMPFFHATRYDFGDLWAGQPPFAVFPSKPVARELSIVPAGRGVVTEISEKSSEFDGRVTVDMDPAGMARVTYEVFWKGADFYAREIGLRIPLNGHDWTLSWERWNEWGDAPDETNMARKGSARPWRGRTPSQAAESVRPRWPWHLDETEEGTTAFRSAKYNILRAALKGPAGGVTVYGSADVHVRAAIEGYGTAFYLLTRCWLGPRLVRKGDMLKGEFLVELKEAQGRPKARP